MSQTISRSRAEPERAFYDRMYRTKNYFGHSRWVFRPFIRALIAVSGLAPGSRVLDAGCGQGFFSDLLAAEGLRVFSTDISVVGLAVTRANARNSRVFASDLMTAAFVRPFDAVFIRSCSLFNTSELTRLRPFIRQLHGMVRPGGVVIFVYNTNASGARGSWTHHRLEDLQASFVEFPSEVAVYLANKLDVLVLGTRAFSAQMTRANKLLARLTGFGAEAVVLSRTPAA